MTLAALKALGLGWGPAHTELTLTASGPVIIEVNPRLAGSLIPELVRLARGIDLVEASISLAIGHDPVLKPTAKGFASIGFVIVSREGRLVNLIGLDVARRVPGVADVQSYVKCGDDLSIRGDFRDKIVHVIGVGATSKAAVEAVEKGLSEIRLIIVERDHKSE